MSWISRYFHGANCDPGRISNGLDNERNNWITSRGLRKIIADNKKII
jgi:hypothetical protein